VTDVFARPVFARARKLCLQLPEASETSSWGHPNFRVARKTFCAFEMVKSRPSIAFRLDTGQRAALLQQKYSFATPYGRGLWVSLWLDKEIDWKLVRFAIERSYRLVATKRLVSMLDGSSGDRP
jgi:predicted DNA-binding protein (MmcQ/YjbR family)